MPIYDAISWVLLPLRDPSRYRFQRHPACTTMLNFLAEAPVPRKDGSYVKHLIP